MSKRNVQGSLSKGSNQNVPETLLTPSPEDEDNKLGSTPDEESRKKPKLAFGVGKIAKPPMKLGIHGPIKKGIQIKLGAQKPAQPSPTVVSKSHAVAAAFNVDDEDEPEEMPPEARMRMRNIGRETPTSAGPNSFGKTKQGFCDNKKMFEKTMKKAMDGSTVPPEETVKILK